MRIEDGCWRSKADRNGQPYFLHRLKGAARTHGGAHTPLTGLNTPRADAAQLHRVYSAFLARLTLSQAHRESLKRRGLSDSEIDRRDYRTLGSGGRSTIARALQAQFGDLLLSVPGFVSKRGRDGDSYLSIAGASGLLVPIRDSAGCIVALLSRPDEGAGLGGKYSFLSSKKYGGFGPGAPAHVPVGVTGPCPICRLTEGALKADVATALSNVPTIGAPGLGWPAALDAAVGLGCKTIRLAFDADALENTHVARALAKCCKTAASADLAVEVERWDKADGKGIDDLLAGGKVPEVLVGDAALRAVAEVLSEATAGVATPESGPLVRLLSVVDEGGAEALFCDGQLLRALAQLAETDRAEFACRRAQLQRAGVKLRDLNGVLAPLRQEIRRDRPPPDVVGCYRVSGGRIVRDVLTKDGPVEVALANWSGRIAEETVHDDGAERRITFSVEGALADGTPLPRADVPADQFAYMRWPVTAWGTRAVVLAGASTADHLRVAMQLLSGEVPRRMVYGHTGWREINGSWCYLHGGGAIGAAGAVAGLAVTLPEALARFGLPAPPVGARLVEAVRASLQLLDLGPDRITVPVIGAVFRAALAEVDFAGGLTGPTGAFKTEFAALAQQHFGAGLDARHLPASWLSTGNALEALAFAAQHTLLVVDDFAPAGSTADVQRMHREAERLLRAQGNRAGRQRMRADATQRPSRPPRGLILSTGEDVPRGQSVRARLLVVELAKGDISPAKLTAAQRDAADGRYAACMAGWVRWLAPRYSTIRAGLGQEHAELRARAIARCDGQHARTPGIVADLALGLKHFLDFAAEARAIEAAERKALWERCWEALVDVGGAQAKHVEAAEPCGYFLRLLAGAIASGRAHVAGPDGSAPESARAWGWRLRPAGWGDREHEEWNAEGQRVGWVDGSDLYLEPEAAFTEAQEMARRQGEALSLGSRTLWQRMRERGLLASWDRVRQRNTVRRTLGGVKDRTVLHMFADALSPPSEPSAPSDNAVLPPISARERAVSAASAAAGNGVSKDNCPPGPTANLEETTVGGRCGRSKTGIGVLSRDELNQEDLPGEGMAGANDAAPAPPPGAQLIFKDAAGRSCGPAECHKWTWLHAPRWYYSRQHPPPLK